MSAPVILFDSSSVELESKVFEIKKQLTIRAIGLQPGDYITFEALSVTAGARSSVCGCFIREATGGAIAGLVELQCPTCESDTPQPVRLTERNPIVILDSPQDSLLRALYHGDGVDLQTVLVTAQETETEDLTDSMRGCPPVCCEDEPQTWVETGPRRCSELGYEAQEISNCGNYRWTVLEPAVWVDNGITRCSEDGYETQQVNQCGLIRWTVQGPAVWTANGITRCNGGNEEAQEVNQCGIIRWTVTGVLTWTANGVTRCNAGNFEVQEVNACAGLRWTVVGPITWTANGTTRCNGANVENQEVNQCGDIRWTAVGPATWNENGNFRCFGGNYQAQEVSSCGDTRWTTIAAVTWTPTGLTQCIGGFVSNQEENQCGNLRYVATIEACATDAIVALPSNVVPATTEDCEIPTTIYGIRDALLGSPDGFINIGNNVVPYYGVGDCCTLPSTILPARAPGFDNDCTLPMATYGGEENLLGRPLGFINYGGYIIPYYGFNTCGGEITPQTTDSCVIPLNVINRRDNLMGEPLGFMDVNGYIIPYYATESCE